MRRMNVQPILNEFTSKVNDSLDLAKAASGLYEKRGGKLRQITSGRQRLLNEMSFLQIFLAWEDFLDQTFIGYMCGGKTASGYRPKSFIKPINMKHARDVLRGARPFVDWLNGQEVIDRAKLYFNDGEPYCKALQGALVKLDEMKTIRNAIAHRSEKSRLELENCCRRIHGYRLRRLSPGLLLMTVAKKSGVTYVDTHGQSPWHFTVQASLDLNPDVIAISHIQ